MAINAYTGHRDDGLPLFQPPPHNGTETSRKAADRVAPAVTGLRAAVLEHIRTSGGATNAEIHEATGIKLQTVCPRVNELHKALLIVDSGRRRNGATVWRVRC